LPDTANPSVREPTGQTHPTILTRVEGGLSSSRIGVGLWARLGDVVVSLAKWAARTTAGQPWVNTAGVEGVTTGKTSDIVVVFQGINADSTGVTGWLQQLRGQGGIDLLVFLVFLLTLCPLEGLPLLTRCGCCCPSICGAGVGCGIGVLRLVFVVLLVIRLRFDDRSRCIGHGGSGWRSLGRATNRAFIEFSGNLAKIRDDAISIPNTVGSTGRDRDATCSRQTLPRTFWHPALVFHHGELLVHLVHGHKLLLAPAPMRARHILHVDRLAVLGFSECSIASVIPEAILDTNNDPEVSENDAEA
jgi:hypothetical protein